LAERYGIETVLRAIAKIKDEQTIPNIQFTVIPKIKNEGPYVDKLLNDAMNLGLEGDFRLLDPVPHDQMPEIIRQADLCVYTPLPDIHMDIALSLKIPEIVAVGRPLVVSRLSVLEKYFGEDALFMCNPGDSNDCAEKIVSVYREPEQAFLRVRRAQEALKKFNWALQKLVYLQLITELLE